MLTLASRLPPKRIEAFVDDTLSMRTASLEQYEEILELRVEGSGAPLPSGTSSTRGRPTRYQSPASELERLSRRLTDRP